MSFYKLITFVFGGVVLSLAGVSLASAQAVATGNIETQMPTEVFKAAGLEKLSAQELATLNDWLQGKLQEETTMAVAVAKEEAKQEAIQEIEDKSRGFFHFGSREPIISTIVGEFRGFAQGRRYTLENGQVWEQIEPASLVGVRKVDVGVSIRPAAFGNAWYMQIDGYNTTTKVQRVE